MFEVRQVICFLSIAKIFMFFPAIVTSTITTTTTTTTTSTTTTTTTTTTPTPFTLPGCQAKCGNLSVPYPFGIGVDGACSLDYPYTINCNSSFYDPPKAFLAKGNVEVLDISIITGQLRMKNIIANNSYYSTGGIIPNNSYYAKVDLKEFPVVFSDVANKFTIVGCDDSALIDGTTRHNSNFTSGCTAWCTRQEDVIDSSCSGIGCCQTSIPNGLKNFYTIVRSYYNHTYVGDFNPYSYAFLGEQSKFNFTVDDLDDPNFMDKTSNNVPIVLDWYVGQNQTCKQAQQHRSSYVCKNNTKCDDFHGAVGYRCSCLPGYQGNPYLSPGCKDIDECFVGTNNTCSNICINIPGSYKCSCPKGQQGDGHKNGTSCTRPTSNNSSHLVTMLSLGVIVGLLALLTLSWICYNMYTRRKLTQKREKLFEQNGGVLLKQQLAQSSGARETSKIYSTDELKTATKNYREDRVLGKGGYGTVYKGIIRNGFEVAIKKSKVADQTQVEQFINEVVILTQINHRNVVKLLGCCLETEVPLLVYEYISNGTLFEHIHRNKGITSWLTWASCIRIASEVADALMYLHSAASIPIIHRDVKSTNILLDESYTAKISDFGASRLVPIDQTQVTTLVQGTLGYLDPEYFHTSQLTEKSDVYSFGIVLAELLTREKPLCIERTIEERNLATYFVLAMKEDRLMEIVDPQLVREASEEQLVKMGKLVKECLNVKGEDRPTMKEVALELEGLKKQNRHPWAAQNNEDTSDLMGEHDLYPSPLNGHQESASTMGFSGQYSMEISLISEMNHPR